MIQLKRVYDRPSAQDGIRILVDRLWPRGLSKASAKLDMWQKAAGPSHELRKWFGHDAEKWKEFQRRFFSELTQNPEAWEPLLERAQKQQVTLLYGSHEAEHNNAVALKRFLEAKLARKRPTAARS